MNDNIKKIIIEPEKQKSQQSKTKKINFEKEIKLRVETKSWGLNEEDLLHKTQLNSLISNNDNKYTLNLLSHIKLKLSGYKQQDIIKKKYNETNFVSCEEVITLLKQSELKCCYCSNNVYILYEIVREMKQWSLDRIDNNLGHNSNNLVVACLECNLKRKRTNKDAFMFTKNMVIVKKD
jgi:hypothetical protein